MEPNQCGTFLINGMSQKEKEEKRLIIEPTKFGETVRNKRLEKNITLRKFAEKLEISPAYLSIIENKQYIPKEEIIKRIAEILEMDFNFLCVIAGEIPKEIQKKLLQKILDDTSRMEFFRKTGDIKYLI